MAGEQELRAQFVEAMSQVAATVNVITSDGPAGRAGMTVSAMASVSADGPRPSLLVCLNESSQAAQTIISNGVFCVNVLKETQAHISDAFAGRAGAQGGERFAGASWVAMASGSPRAEDPLVAFDCEVVQAHSVGTHKVLIAQVGEIHRGGGGNALIYAQRGYATSLALEPEARASAQEHLRIAMPADFGVEVIPYVLARLHQARPNLEISLTDADSTRVLAALRSGAADVGLLHGFDLEPGLAYEGLTGFSPSLLMRDDHLLAQREQVALHELAGSPLVMLDVPPLNGYFATLLKESGVDMKVSARARGLEMVCAMVAQGLGCALLMGRPFRELHTAAQEGERRLVLRPVSEDAGTCPVVLAWPEGRERSAAAQEFAALCREGFGNAPQP